MLTPPFRRRNKGEHASDHDSSGGAVGGLYGATSRAGVGAVVWCYYAAKARNRQFLGAVLLLMGLAAAVTFSEISTEQLPGAPSSVRRVSMGGPSLKPTPLPTVRMVDHSEKLMVLGAPKGGATLATQLMLKHLDLMDAAMEYDPWIHNYRYQVFIKQPEHQPVRCSSTCAVEEEWWICVKLVRSVLDRAVSSYIHTMVNAIKDRFPELSQVMKSNGNSSSVSDASFAEFVDALDLRAKGHCKWFFWCNYTKSWADDHFMPQSDDDCTIEGGVLHVPIEAVHESLRVIDEKWSVNLNATGLTSHHYRVGKAKDEGSDGSNAALQDFSKRPFQRSIPPYQTFLQNPEVNKVLCRVYRSDLELYAKTCRQSWLLDNDHIQAVCLSERGRVRQVCGPAYDFWR